jgi:hypothetical protein
VPQYCVSGLALTTAPPSYLTSWHTLQSVIASHDVAENIMNTNAALYNNLLFIMLNRVFINKNCIPFQCKDIKTQVLTKINPFKGTSVKIMIKACIIQEKGESFCQNENIYKLHKK